MRFLVAAQLPARLARLLSQRITISELPNGNRTTDAEIASRADAEDRVVVTKGRDFRNSYLLRSTPGRLLIVGTANISNNELVARFDRFLDLIVASLNEVRFVELGLTS